MKPRERAKALLEDIQAWEPKKYEELMRNGEEKALETLTGVVKANEARQEEMKLALLNQMEPTTDPMEAAGNEAWARMTAMEMAQEELRDLY